MSKRAASGKRTVRHSLLASEIKQTKQLPPEQEAFSNLQRTAAVLMQEVEAELGRARTTPTQYNILRILRGAGPQGIRCGEIARRLVTQDPDVTRLLDRLYRRGYLDRLRVERDRRVVIVHITASGLRLLKTLDGPILRAQQKQFQRLTKNEMKAFNEMCERLRRRE